MATGNSAASALLADSVTGRDSGLLVIGAGAPRTGTMSMKSALEQLLGGTCHHMTEIMTHRRGDIRAWEAAVQRGRLEKAEADGLLRGCTACMDFPAGLFYQDLMQHYPSARVVLTVREPLSWAVNSKATVMYTWSTWKEVPGPLLRLLGVEHAPRMLQAAYRLAFGVALEPGIPDAALAEAYAAYNDRVRRSVPPDRLLEFQPADGWRPLCAFLGLPVPEGLEFPRLNDTQHFRRTIHAMRLVNGLMKAAAAAAVVLAVAAAVKAAMNRWL